VFGLAGLYAALICRWATRILIARKLRKLDVLEENIADGRPFLLGDRLTEVEIRLFVTLIRFDSAYHGLFKTNLKRIADYPNLQNFVERFFALPGVAETVSFDH